MTGRLHGRSAIVTGGGSGIGRAVAQRYAAEGAATVVNDVDRDAAEATVAMIEEGGGRGLAVVGDVTSSEFVEQLIGTAVEELGRLDVMHNNAGAQLANSLISELTDDEWARTMALNVTATFFGIRAALRAMVPQGSGSIISTSSLAGVGGVAGSAAYATAKAGVVQLTRVAALEFAHTGVRINCIIPGTMHTPGMQQWMDDAGIALADWARQIPQGRLGQPDDIAGAALFLASDDSAYVNGVALPVDGARLAKLGGPHPDHLGGGHTERR